MKAVIDVSEEQNGSEYVVIHKIREITNQFGTVIIRFDNGDSKSITPENSGEFFKKILEQIESYYG